MTYQAIADASGVNRESVRNNLQTQPAHLKNQQNPVPNQLGCTMQPILNTRSVCAKCTNSTRLCSQVKKGTANNSPPFSYKNGEENKK